VDIAITSDGITAVDNATIDNSVIGGTTPAAAAFTSIDLAGSDLQGLLDAKASLVSPSFTTPTLGVATATSISVTGIDNDTDISISGADCKYQVNGAGDWLTSGDNVILNDNVALRVLSSPNYSTDKACTLTLGGVISDTWHVTTIAAQQVDYIPIPPRMRAHLRQSPTGYTPPADPGYVGHVPPGCISWEILAP